MDENAISGYSLGAIWIKLARRHCHWIGRRWWNDSSTLRSGLTSATTSDVGFTCIIFILGVSHQDDKPLGLWSNG